MHAEHHHHFHELPVNGENNAALRRAYWISIALNLAFVVVEFLAGRISHSMGLVSDAGHKMLDVFALGMALVGFHLAGRSSSDARRISAIIALINTCILLFGVSVIVRESIDKLRYATPVDGSTVSWTAALGILVSGLSAWLLMRHRGDINTRAAFLHMATDSLLSLGVVIAGIVISLTSLYVIDPVISLVLAAVILFNTLRLLRDALRTLFGK
ncbi:MAG: cation transporter [Bacteroidales bacterium]|nr:cation transporter [Bacteroidales bacterium]